MTRIGGWKSLSHVIFFSVYLPIAYLNRRSLFAKLDPWLQCWLSSTKGLWRPRFVGQRCKKCRWISISNAVSDLSENRKTHWSPWLQVLCATGCWSSWVWFHTEPSLYLSLKMMVSPRSSVTASTLNSGSHLVGASGFGFLFLGLGFGPAVDIYTNINGQSSCYYGSFLFITNIYICPP